MFDYVRYEAPCRKCGLLLTNWQTKDLDEPFCNILEVDNPQIQRFYDNCKTCDTWNEFEKHGNILRLLDDSELPDYKKRNRYELQKISNQRSLTSIR